MTHNLDLCISKIREVRLDLTEPQDGSSLAHQARKLEEVERALERIAAKPGASTQVHGGGTGEE